MKKIIIAALTAVMALSVFTGCNYKAATFEEKAMETYPVELTEDTVKVGYGMTLVFNEDKSITLEDNRDASQYSQVAIKLPFQGFPKAELDISTTGKTTIGFLTAGASPWDGRIADADIYKDTPLEQGKIKIDVPADAAFITIGANGEVDKVIVKSITLCAK